VVLVRHGEHSGEDSLHKTKLSLQMIETLTNLASVVETAQAKVGGVVE